MAEAQYNSQISDNDCRRLTKTTNHDHDQFQYKYQRQTQFALSHYSNAIYNQILSYYFKTK